MLFLKDSLSYRHTLTVIIICHRRLFLRVPCYTFRKIIPQGPILAFKTTVLEPSGVKPAIRGDGAGLAVQDLCLKDSAGVADDGLGFRV